MEEHELQPPPQSRFDHDRNALSEQESARYLAKLESRHNKLKGKDGSRPTAGAMVKELGQAREDHLNNFLSTDNPQPYSTAWGAQDLSRDRDDNDNDSDDTWSSDSEKETNCCSCYRMPYWQKRKQRLSPEQEDDEMGTALVCSDELSREHELQES